MWEEGGHLNKIPVLSKTTEMGWERGLIPVRSKTVILGNLASGDGGILRWTNLPTDNTDK